MEIVRRRQTEQKRCTALAARSARNSLDAHAQTRNGLARGRIGEWGAGSEWGSPDSGRGEPGPWETREPTRDGQYTFFLKRRWKRRACFHQETRILSKNLSHSPPSFPRRLLGRELRNYGIIALIFLYGFDSLVVASAVRLGTSASSLIALSSGMIPTVRQCARMSGANTHGRGTSLCGGRRRAFWTFVELGSVTGFFSPSFADYRRPI